MVNFHLLISHWKRLIQIALKCVKLLLFYRIMKTHLTLLAAAFGLSLPTPLLAGASSFSVVNGSGADISAIAIRRVGSSKWQSLGVAATMGKAAAVSFSDPDCAFDLKATMAGGVTVTWSGVNLCDVKLLTLRRSDTGLAWVDYD